MALKDPKKRAEYNKQYRAKRGKDLYEKNRAYRAANPDIYRAVEFANMSNKRSRWQGCEGKLWGRDVVKIDGPCAYCGGEATGWDHVLPFFHGGPNVIENVVRCCFDCNLRKSFRTPEQWLELQDWVGC